MNTATATTAQEINLISYNIHGQKLREGIIKIDFEKEKVIFPSGKEYSVINDYEFTYKILKGTIKAAGEYKVEANEVLYTYTDKKERT